MPVHFDPPGPDRGGLVPASGTISDFRNANRRARAYIPELLRNQDPTKFPPVYIFNIFDREHKVYCGSRGLKTIPACPKDKPYSEPLVLRAVEVDEFDLADGGGNMSFTADEGRAVAEDLVGVRSTYSQLGLYTTNLEWWGVFISDSNPPTKKELDAARRKLTAQMRLIFENGKKLAESGPLGLAQISENHNLAAEFLGVPKSWTTAPEVARTTCPECKESIMPGARICIHCRTKLDGNGNVAKGA